MVLDEDPAPFGRPRRTAGLRHRALHNAGSTAALLQTYLFATGVTLTVTSFRRRWCSSRGWPSTCWSGPAKKGEEPVCNLPAPPGVATLVPSRALALALAMLLGLAPGDWFMIPIAILVLAAGLPTMGAAREETPRTEPLENGRPVAPAACHSAWCCLVLARGYLGPIVNGWTFPRAWTATSTR